MNRDNTFFKTVANLIQLGTTQSTKLHRIKWK